jgi:hypothetical protein
MYVYVCASLVVATASEIEIHAKAVSPDPKDDKTMAAQLARQSSAWRKRIKIMNDFHSHKLLSQRKKLKQCDLTESASRYIIFEGYDEPQSSDDKGCYNEGPKVHNPTWSKSPPCR